jgi:hypothetical protein
MKQNKSMDYSMISILSIGIWLTMLKKKILVINLLIIKIIFFSYQDK